MVTRIRHAFAAILLVGWVGFSGVSVPAGMQKIDPRKGINKQILYQSGYFGARQGRVTVDRAVETPFRKRLPGSPWDPANLVWIGDSIRSEADGRYELLLLPGDYLRSLGNSRLTMDMVTPTLLLVRLDAGSFVYERGGGHAYWTVFATPNGSVFTNGDGVFRIDVEKEATTVWSPRLGTAFVSRFSSKTRILDSLSDPYRRAPLDARPVRPDMVAVTRADADLDITEKKREDDDLDKWSTERAKTLAEINLRQNEEIRAAANRVRMVLGSFFGTNPGVGFGYDTYFFPLFDSVTGKWKPGEIAWTSRDVRIRRGSVLTHASVGACIFPDGGVSTGPGGRVEVRLGEKSAFRLAANSSVSINEKTGGEPEFLIDSGNIQIVGKGDKGIVNVVLPGRIGVILREGDYRFSVAPNGASDIEVRSGKLALSMGGNSVEVGKGNRARVAGTSLTVTKVKEFDADLFDGWPLCAVAKPAAIQIGFWMFDEASGFHVFFPPVQRYESPYGKYLYNFAGRYPFQVWSPD